MSKILNLFLNKQTKKHICGQIKRCHFPRDSCFFIQLTKCKGTKRESERISHMGRSTKNKSKWCRREERAEVMGAAKEDGDLNR
jgi:hypothetical protein